MEEAAGSRHYQRLLGEIFALRQCARFWTIGRGSQRQDGLESVKKTLQVAWVGTGHPMHRPPRATQTFDLNPIRICL
jgi:hypothetical protein